MDEKSQVILWQLVTASSPDVEQLRPAIENLELLLGRRPEKVLADAGYWSESNFRHLEAQQIESLLAPGRMKHNAPAPLRLGSNPGGVDGQGADVAQVTDEARSRRLCAREAIVEALFGQTK